MMEREQEELKAFLASRGKKISEGEKLDARTISREAASEQLKQAQELQVGLGWGVLRWLREARGGGVGVGVGGASEQLKQAQELQVGCAHQAGPPLACWRRHTPHPCFPHPTCWAASHLPASPPGRSRQAAGPPESDPRDVFRHWPMLPSPSPCRSYFLLPSSLLPPFLQRRLAKVAKQLDHLERARREEEAPLLGATREARSAEDASLFARQQEEARAAAQAAWERDAAEKKRVARMEAERESIAAQIQVWGG